MESSNHTELTDAEIEAISTAADAIVDQRVFYQPTLFVVSLS